MEVQNVRFVHLQKAFDHHIQNKKIKSVFREVVLDRKAFTIIKNLYENQEEYVKTKVGNTKPIDIENWV